MNLKSISQAKDYYDYLFKFVIEGNSWTGKTSFIHRYCDNSFFSEIQCTIRLDFRTKKTEFEEKVIKLQLWDSPGHERCIYKAYCKGTKGVIIMYSINDRRSFEHIEEWMKKLFTSMPLDVVFILVGNKCDLENRQVETSEGKKMAESYDMPFFEVSVKEGINVNEVIQELIKQVMSQKKV